MAFDLDTALRLAGYALAHAAWSIEDGETLIPLAVTEIDRRRELVRFVDAGSDPLDVIRGDLRDRLTEHAAAAVVLDPTQQSWVNGARTPSTW